MPEPIVFCESLVKIYKIADLEVFALQGLDLKVYPGEMIAIVGASGSGKSTLLNILSGLDTMSAGKCVVDGYDLTALKAAQWVHYQRQVIGQLWQQSGRNLFPEMSAQMNIELPQMLNGIRRAHYKHRAQDLLSLVGMDGMGHKRPAEFSGGEQQRISLAVALANQPNVLFADEPTGELDSVTAAEIIATMRRLNQELGLTIIIVTHDVTIASMVDRTIAISGGHTSTETIRRKKSKAFSAADRPGHSAVIGLPAETHRESVIIDRLGRLQLPKEALERIPFYGRAEIIIEDNRLILLPSNAEKENQPPEAEHVSTEKRA